MATKRIERENNKVRQGQRLNVIFHTGIPAFELYCKVRAIEKEAGKLAEDCCNHLSMESDEFKDREAKIKDKIEKLLSSGPQKIPVFINFDPRGYALKIESEYVKQHSLEIERDWGGYGIIAPAF